LGVMMECLSDWPSEFKAKKFEKRRWGIKLPLRNKLKGGRGGFAKRCRENFLSHRSKATISTASSKIGRGTRRKL